MENYFITTLDELPIGTHFIFGTEEEIRDYVSIFNKTSIGCFERNYPTLVNHKIDDTNKNLIVTTIPTCEEEEYGYVFYFGAHVFKKYHKNNPFQKKLDTRPAFRLGFIALLNRILRN